MRVVSNCSPLTNLIAVGRIDLLQRLYGEILIAEGVCSELSVAHPDVFSDNASHLTWIIVRQVTDRSEVTDLLTDLDVGEAETLVLMREVGADLALIDERKARRKAANTGFRNIGLIGVLLEAKAQGYVDRVKPILDELIREAGFWVSESLYTKVLEITGEG